MPEVHLDLQSLRCPRCAGELVLRVLAEERGKSVQLTLDTACVSCGVSPWTEPDQRLVLFQPGAKIGALSSGAGVGGDGCTAAPEPDPGPAALLAGAQARIDALLRRVDSLERDLASARREVAHAAADERKRRGALEDQLRADITRLEGALAEARVEVRRAGEATRGQVAEGKRAIELE